MGLFAKAPYPNAGYGALSVCVKQEGIRTVSAAYQRKPFYKIWTLCRQEIFWK